MTHTPPSSDVEADAPQSQAAMATPRQNVARTDGCKSVPTQVLLVSSRFVRTPSSQCPESRSAHPRCAPVPPAFKLRRLYARVVSLLMCASLCHAHLVFGIDHREPSTLTLQVPLLARRHIVVLIVASASAFLLSRLRISTCTSRLGAAACISLFVRAGGWYACVRRTHSTLCFSSFARELTQ